MKYTCENCKCTYCVKNFYKNYGVLCMQCLECEEHNHHVEECSAYCKDKEINN